MNFYPVPGYEEYLEVTKDGVVRTLDRNLTNALGNFVQKGKIRKQFLVGTVGNQYYSITLSLNKVVHNLKVHRLVALTFIPNPDNLPCINHKDANKFNNSVENLEWCTHKYNTQHAVKMGLWKAPIGEKNGKAVLTDLEVAEIKSLRSLGYSSRELNKMYPTVCRRTIMNIYQNKTRNISPL
jgi:hypothetical protein